MTLNSKYLDGPYQDDKKEKKLKNKVKWKTTCSHEHLKRIKGVDSGSYGSFFMWVLKP